MYAIRSYYVHPQAVDRHAQTAQEARGRRGLEPHSGRHDDPHPVFLRGHRRITSYNVCYTKLLREYVEFVQATSYRDRSVVIVKFLDDKDYDKLFTELRLKVLGQMNELPQGIDPPSFTKIDVSEFV